MENAIVKTNVINTYDDVERAALAFAASKYFMDAADKAQAVVKILAGQEIGIGAFASMTGIHVIKGKPTYGANILAAKVKGSGKYDYLVIEISEKACELEFYQGSRAIGKSRFTIEDARKAGTQNVDRFPRNMLFARAISNGVRWYCPDVLNGVTAYVPEEFGAVVDDSGNIVDGTIVTPQATPQEAQPGVILDADRPGKITPALCVELKLSENEFAAKNMLRGLKFLQSTLAADALPIIRIYRAERDNGATEAEAYAIALDPKYGSDMPDPRTGDGENF